MKIEDVGTYLSRGRIIDLTRKVEPGKATGPSGTDARKYEIKLFTYPPGELMHNIKMESHISTHVEAPSHFIPARYGRSADDISELALTKFFGMAVLVDCKDLPPRTAIGEEILRKSPIEENDIVLIGRCPYQGEKRCYSAKEGMEYLLQKKIKMLGFDNTVHPEDLIINSPPDLKKMYTHDLMLSNDIPIIEGLANLSELKKTRFLFFGFPAKMGGLESFPIRAVAIEGK